MHTETQCMYSRSAIAHLFITIVFGLENKYMYDDDDDDDDDDDV